MPCDGAASSDGGSMNKRETLTLLEEGKLEEMVESLKDIPELHSIHNVLFHRALEFGVLRVELIKRIDGMNYSIAREANMDMQELAFMNRKMLVDYDPNVAVLVYKRQIEVMLNAIKEAEDAAETGTMNPAADIFNRKAYGQTLATSDKDGNPTVAVFTGLAELRDDKVVYGHISADNTYEGLKATPRAVFSAVGPSNDPTKTDFVTIDVELEEDLTEGELLDELREKLDSAVKRALVFAVKDVEVFHLPKVTRI